MVSRLLTKPANLKHLTNQKIFPNLNSIHEADPSTTSLGLNLHKNQIHKSCIDPDFSIQSAKDLTQARDPTIVNEFLNIDFKIIKKSEEQPKKSPGGPPPPGFNVFKDISRNIRRAQNETVFPLSLGTVPEHVDKYISEDVKVQVNLHLRGYYDRLENLQNIGNKVMDASDAGKERSKEDQEKINNARQKMTKIFSDLDPTGTYKTLFGKPGYYKNLKIKGKANAKKEFKAACLFAVHNFALPSLTVQEHNNNEEEQVINSKLQWSCQMDQGLMGGHSNFKIYTYYTVKDKKIIKIEITDVKKSTLSDKAKDAVEKAAAAMAKSPTSMKGEKE